MIPFEELLGVSSREPATLHAPRREVGFRDWVSRACRAGRPAEFQDCLEAWDTYRCGDFRLSANEHAALVRGGAPACVRGNQPGAASQGSENPLSGRRSPRSSEAAALPPSGFEEFQELHCQQAGAARHDIGGSGPDRANVLLDGRSCVRAFRRAAGLDGTLNAEEYKAFLDAARTGS